MCVTLYRLYQFDLPVFRGELPANPQDLQYQFLSNSWAARGTMFRSDTSTFIQISKDIHMYPTWSQTICKEITHYKKFNGSTGCLLANNTGGSTVDCLLSFGSLWKHKLKFSTPGQVPCRGIATPMTSDFNSNARWVGNTAPGLRWDRPPDVSCPDVSSLSSINTLLRLSLIALKRF